MARPKIPGRKLSAESDCMSVAEFCDRNAISVQLFYKLRPQGLMPATFKLGVRTLITKEAAERWRKARERESA